MSGNDEEFNRKYEQLTQRLAADRDQDDASWRNRYLSLTPEAREALKSVVAQLENASLQLMCIPGLHSSCIQLAFPEFRKGHVRMLAYGLLEQLNEWDRESVDD